jgi:hypothetical protein
VEKAMNEKGEELMCKICGKEKCVEHEAAACPWCLQHCHPKIVSLQSKITELRGALEKISSCACAVNAISGKCGKCIVCIAKEVLERTK